MNSSHARILLLVGLAGGLASCHDTSTSDDAMYGPENVLQAPLLSEENVQFNKKNRELYEDMIADSMFFVKKKHAGTETVGDTAGAVHAMPDANAEGAAHAMHTHDSLPQTK